MCEHDLAEMETVCADGMCPICLLSRIRILEEGIKDIIRMTEHMELNQFHIKRELQKLLELIESFFVGPII